MRDEKLKVAVVGVGKMGEYHLEKYLRVPEAQVVGFYEANPKRALYLQEKYPVKAYSNLSELFFDVDAVSIASPTTTHFFIAKQALESGVNVLVEKPICESEEHAAELVKIAHQRELVLQVGFLERFRLLKLGRVLDSSPVHYIEAHWLSPTLPREIDIDVLSDLVVHPLDLILSLVKEDPCHISATGMPVITPLLDVANIRLEFPNGVVANLSGSRVSAHRERRLHILGQRKHSLVNFLTNHVENLSFEGGKNTRTAYGLDDFHGLQPDVLYDQCEAFVRACTNKTKPVVTGEDGLRVLQVSGEVRRKIQERSIWKTLTQPQTFDQGLGA